ncbi:MAG: MerR family DNA-binding transcriptional regulator [Alphaproteobacteria bacterium]|nr:MAG: MerR family DNA-binding transcriptional regulator [Alphaproteobacteria bacterium]
MPNELPRRAIPPMPASRYSIADLAREFDVTPRALRFYEDQGLLTPERRGQSRLYSAADRARLAWILRGKRVGFSLAEIAEMLDLYALGDHRTTQRRRTLTKCRERIAALARQRDDIDQMIAELEAFTELLAEIIENPAREAAARARFHAAVGESGVGPARLAAKPRKNDTKAPHSP